MKATVITQIPFTITAESLAKRMRLDEELFDEFKAVYDECLAVANPKAIHIRTDVRQEGELTYLGEHPVDSKIMKVNFKGLTRAFPYVCTCGRELYELALSKSDPLERYWVDAFSERILSDAVVRNLGATMDEYGTERLDSMNPGSLPDFPVARQEIVFALLGDVRGEIGVELTDSYLMLPYKSCSGVYFESSRHYVNCALCPREKCPNRRAKFDPEKMEETYDLHGAE